ncbi:MAG: SCO family protein [Saprospiraceae bacterium]|nr:SCO family protein [Saprospiraceae bacterium]
MKVFKSRTNWPFFIMAALISACHSGAKKQSRVDTLPYFCEATFTPHWLAPDDAALDTFHRISSFQLIDQDGDTITEKDFAGKIYIADFFFTICPGICPKMTNNMAVLQEAFLENDQILLLSHSVMPEYDSVAVLKKYANEKGVQSGKWHLVTGDEQQIYRLGRRDYFVEEDLGLNKEESDFLHTENFVLIDRNRHIRGIYNGLNTASILQLIADVKTLQKENRQM